MLLQVASVALVGGVALVGDQHDPIPELLLPLVVVGPLPEVLGSTDVALDIARRTGIVTSQQVGAVAPGLLDIEGLPKVGTRAGEQVPGSTDDLGCGDPAWDAVHRELLDVPATQRFSSNVKSLLR